MTQSLIFCHLAGAFLSEIARFAIECPWTWRNHAARITYPGGLFWSGRVGKKTLHHWIVVNVAWIVNMIILLLLSLFLLLDVHPFLHLGHQCSLTIFFSVHCRYFQA